MLNLLTFRPNQFTIILSIRLYSIHFNLLLVLDNLHDQCIHYSVPVLGRRCICISQRLSYTSHKDYWYRCSRSLNPSRIFLLDCTASLRTDRLRRAALVELYWHCNWINIRNWLSWLNDERLTIRMQANCRKDQAKANEQISFEHFLRWER